MGFQIELDSELDFERSYESVRQSKYSCQLVQGVKGGFSFSLNGLDKVRYVVHGTGRVQLFTDDWSDPAILIDIARSILVDKKGKPLELKLAKYFPHSSFKEEIWRALRRKQIGIQPKIKWQNLDYLAEWADHYSKRIREACEHLHDKDYWHKVYKENTWILSDHLAPIEPVFEERNKTLTSIGSSIRSDDRTNNTASEER